MRLSAITSSRYLPRYTSAKPPHLMGSRFSNVTPCRAIDTGSFPDDFDILTESLRSACLKESGSSAGVTGELSD